MAAPDRKAEVAAIVADHDALWPRNLKGEKLRASVDLKRGLTAIIALRLNRQFGDRWDMLRRKDRGNKISEDNIVWRSGHEHFDVLTDFGPTWVSHGIVEQMAWYDPGDAVYVDPATVDRPFDPVLDAPLPPPPPAPEPVPDPGIDPDLGTIAADVRAIRALLERHFR